MHRLPLILETRSISWDRRLPDYVLFNNTLNVQNVLEMANLLDVFDKETTDFFHNFEIAATGLLNQAEELLDSKNVTPEDAKKAMLILNEIILRAPKTSKDLWAALKLRGNRNLKLKCYEEAMNDYEMFLYVYEPTTNFEDLCEVSGNLTICYFSMGEFQDAKIHFLAYENFRDCLSMELRQKPPFCMIEKSISIFSSELKNIDDVVPKMGPDLQVPFPFKGFNSSRVIPLSSSACFYVTGQESLLPRGVYATSLIPKESIVFVEDPIWRTINAPFVQCEMCFRRCTQAYTCVNCRCKTYCSLQCMEKNKSSHWNECYGYRCLVLLVLDAVSLFNIFLQISKVLDENLFKNEIFGKLTTAAEVFETMEKLIPLKGGHGLQYLQMLKKKPDYEELSGLEYAALVAKAFRLTIFIEKNTYFIDAYYKKLPISSKQKMLVVGVILMRINFVLMKETYDFELTYPLTEERHKQKKTVMQEIDELALVIKPVREQMVESVEHFYQCDKQTDILNPSHQQQTKEFSRLHIYRTSLQHTQPCDSNQRQLIIYKDIISECYFKPDAIEQFIRNEAGLARSPAATAFLCERIWFLNEMERYLFVHQFLNLFHHNFADYFLVMYDRQQCVRQTLSMYCSTMRNFRHSCCPNVELILTGNGRIMGKALRPIAEGEELVLTYKAHYQRHTRLERELYLKGLHLACECEICKMPEVDEPTDLRLGIYCDTCEKEEITPAKSRCPKCNSSYNVLCMKYQNDVKFYENDIYLKEKPNADDRELYILHSICYHKVRKYFLPFNEHRIRNELNFAKFLALKNFAQQSYDILMEVKANVLRNYDEHMIWFTFYADILMIINIILYYNLDEGLYSVSTTYLHNLCELGMYIIDGQKQFVNLYESFDAEGGAVLDNLRIFLVRKEMVGLKNDSLSSNETAKSRGTAPRLRKE